MEHSEEEIDLSLFSKEEAEWLLSSLMLGDDSSQNEELQQNLIKQHKPS